MQPSPDERNPAGWRGFEEAQTIGDGLHPNGSASRNSALSLSVITASNPARLSKHFELVDGALVKHAGGELVRGAYQRVEVEGAEGLAALVAGLARNQALTFGVAKVKAAPISSTARAQAGDITRTRDHFDWPAGPGVMFLDYDPPKDVEPLTADALLSALVSAWPALAHAPAVQGTSGSTYIYDASTGAELKGAGGLRGWVPVADARDIPRAGKALFERLWLAGHGYYQVSKAGTLLARSLIDAAVFQPERLDFAAGASCGDGLEQRRPALRVLNAAASPIDTATLRDLDADERIQLADIQAAAKAAAAPEQAQMRSAWVDARVADWSKSAASTLAGMPDDAAATLRESIRAQFERAVVDRRLFGDFELIHSSGRKVTVGEILDDPRRWHNERFADPLEPGYGRDSRIAWANLRSGGRPYIHSHAHGGQRFTLERPSATIQVAQAEGPRIVQQADELLRLHCEVYQRGGQLVRVADGGIHAVTGPYLRNHLETIATFQKFDKRSGAWHSIDCPGELHTRLLHNRGAWSVPELTGVIRAPILRPDGSLLSSPGFDEHTGLLLLADHPDNWPAIPERPSADAVREALATLWEPFEHFPFASALDRGVHLAACLTAVQRLTLNTAPGFAWDAPTPASGKTKAAQAVGWLAGVEVPVSPWATEPEEQRKSLMASLLGGVPGILLDNINGQLASDTLCAMLTGSQISDRKLGVSEQVTVPTRVLVLATGNNITIVGDLARRVLPIRLDHGVEAPDKLEFPFCPVARMRERWLYYRAAALTVLRGFVVAGMPANGTGSTGSFEQWDRLIRQCVVWVRDQDLARFTVDDPAKAVARNQAANPEMMKLRALISAWFEVYGDTPMIVQKAANVPGGLDDAAGALHDACDEIAGERGVINPRRLGRWIEGRQGRLVDGKRFVRGPDRGNRATWKVEAVA